MATFGYAGHNANCLAFPADVFPLNMVGSIWGLASMGAGFGRMLFSWLSGAVMERFGYLPVIVGYGILPVIALALVLGPMGPLVPHPKFCGQAAQPPDS